jgi:hypothetical protein
MFTNIYVHILEVLAALLVVATTVQIFRCYRSTYQTFNDLTPLTSSSPKQIEKSYSGSGNILHDYIGEFFIDEARADEISVNELKAYKNADVSSVKSKHQAELTAEFINVATEKNVILDSASERSNVFSFDARAEATAGIGLSEDDDDTVIKVMTSSNAPTGIVDNKIMSDKVVLAMLDEAKLVCTS